MIKKTQVKFSNPLLLIKEGNCFLPEGRKRLPYTPLGEKGTKLPWGISSQMFDKKYRGSNLSKLNVLYTIGKPLKNRYLK
jgi:hypothetical protein